MNNYRHPFYLRVQIIIEGVNDLRIDNNGMYQINNIINEIFIS